MKKRMTVLLVACMLMLAACAGFAASEPLPQSEAPEISEEAVETYEAPEYETVPFTFGNQVRSEDDETVLAICSYQTLQLAVHNPDAISPADAEMAERAVETFNNKMDAVNTDLGEQEAAIAADAAEIYAEYGSLSAEYEDSAEMNAAFCGDVISTCLYRWSYTGGAHPNRYAVSYMFDLEAGQFIDPIQLADDPEAFRTGAAALLVEKADAWGQDAGGFWEDYAEVIAQWNTGTVQFTEEGMRIIYSPYELGPYSMGEVELLLDWEELEPLLGPGGMERLGRGNET